MKKNFDIITIGDNVYDVFIELDQAEVVCKKNNCLLCVNYADKVAVKNIIPIPAVGNSSNVAIGCSRLGLKTALYTIVGDDDIGHATLKVYKQEKVATDYVKIDKKHKSNYHVVLTYKGERTILVYHQPRDYSLPPLAPARWVYYSSVSPHHQILHKQVPAYIKRSGAKLVFNPGTFQLKEGIKGLRKILEVTEVLLVNKEEAQRLVGNFSDIKKLLTLLAKTGPKVIVITDGPNGSYCFDGHFFYFLEILKMPVLERTGAGDAYSTGFVAALAYGKDVKEAMRWGSANSASVIQQVGARAGLLKKSALVRLLAAHPHFKPKVI
jgi:sugar/nucleoside kinase (ribokinase family)